MNWGHTYFRCGLKIYRPAVTYRKAIYWQDAKLLYDLSQFKHGRLRILDISASHDDIECIEWKPDAPNYPRNKLSSGIGV